MLANRVRMGSYKGNKHDDNSGSPGNNMLIAGDMTAGYFGEVSASELITGDDLALIVGISEGVSQNSTGGWLKFAYKNKVQFVAKKTFRRQFPWNSINSANCVFGGAVIEIGGLSYKVRLPSTATNDPSSNDSTSYHYSEWNKLMLPIHIKAKDGSWKYIANVENDLEYWGIDFTDIDLNTGGSSAEGGGSWCQESWTSNNGRAHMRGYNRGDASEANVIVKTSTTVATGWRPVLELIE